MSEEPTQYSGFSKQKSIWGTPLASQHDKWSPRKMFTSPLPAAPTPSTPAAPTAQSFDYLYYKPVGAQAAAGPGGSVSPVPSAPAPVPASQTPSHSSVDEDLIPTAIVVKNIPFAIKKEQLVEVMTHLGLPLPYAFNYHFDNGVFRGLAFANYATAEETAVVISTLNGREIGGRKLRVEYKKMLPLQERERIEREKRERRGQLEEQHTSQSSSLASSPLSQTQSIDISGGAGIAPAAAPAAAAASGVGAPLAPLATHHHRPLTPPILDLNDKETLDLYTSLVLFSAQPVSEVTLARTSPNQRQIIQKLCSCLGLGLEDRDGNLVVHSTGYTAYPSALFPH